MGFFFVIVVILLNKFCISFDFFFMVVVDVVIIFLVVDVVIVIMVFVSEFVDVLVCVFCLFIVRMKYDDCFNVKILRKRVKLYICLLNDLKVYLFFSL